MKTKLFLTVLLSLLFVTLYSQDMIYTKDGKRIYCKLTGEDSLNVYYSTTKKKTVTEASLSRDQISSIDYVTRLPYVSSSDSIVVRNNNLYYRGKLMNFVEFNSVLQTNEVAYKKYKSATVPSAFANILAGVGGGLIGYPIGTKLGGGDPNWAMAGVGAGLVAVAIPVSMISAKKSRDAINIYNTGVTPAASNMKDRFSVGFASSGIGISIRF